MYLKQPFKVLSKAEVDVLLSALLVTVKFLCTCCETSLNKQFEVHPRRGYCMVKIVD